MFWHLKTRIFNESIRKIIGIKFFWDSSNKPRGGRSRFKIAEMGSYWKDKHQRGFKASIHNFKAQDQTDRAYRTHKENRVWIWNIWSLNFDRTIQGYALWRNSTLSLSRICCQVQRKSSGKPKHHPAYPPSRPWKQPQRNEWMRKLILDPMPSLLNKNYPEPFISYS